MTNEAKELLKSKPELCKEIYEACFGQSLPFCEWIKEHTKKDWEILSFKHTRNNELILLKEDGSYGYEPMDYKGLSLECMLHKGDCVDNGLISIRSVRRLSDNEVFTDSEETMQGKINRFGIVDGTMMVECESKFAECDLNINDLIKRTPLFITEDGKEVFEGEEYCWVNESDYDNIRKSTAHKETEISGFATFRFSTREAAEQWVEDHKPKFSKDQIIKAVNSDDTKTAIQNLLNQ